MDVLLIKSGLVENCISADSVERAQQFYPDHLCVERVGTVGPGYTTSDNGVTFVPPPAPPAMLPDLRITEYAFLYRRMRSAERIRLDLGSIGATVEAASLRDFRTALRAAQWVDLALPELAAALAQLEALGVLDGPDRAVEILTAPVDEIERPSAMAMTGGEA